ncbi:MAG: hypothetical protein UH963_08405 [Agathobacter sp.]|nr:hypothetical protein [Agathobacter sp.]
MNDALLMTKFKNISDYAEKRTNELLKDYGLTAGQGRILMVLAMSESGSYSMSELKDIFKVSQPTEAGIVARLEKKGDVECFYEDYNKKRKKVRLTRQGKNIVESVGNKVLKIEDMVLGSLEEKEKAELVRLINKICEFNV